MEHFDAVESRQRLPRGGRVEPARQPEHVALADDGAKLLQCAVGLDLSIVDDGQPVAEVLRLFHVVRGVQHTRAPSGLLPNQVE